MKTFVYRFFKKLDMIQFLINSISVKYRYIQAPLSSMQQLLKNTNSHQKKASILYPCIKLGCIIMCLS